MNETSSGDAVAWEESEQALSGMQDRLGKAGFFSKSERKRARRLMGTIIGGFGVAGGVGGALYSHGLNVVLPGVVCGSYLGLMVWLYYLRYRVKDLEREILFQLPLVLEGIILLVEAGLGVLPAIERVVSAKEETGDVNPVVRILRLVYEIAAHGAPLGRALEMVGDAMEFKPLRHVLLHLDISSAEGGELVPALRSLSDHAHTEWRLSVETRVKRLENLVVFPVFASVIGLLFLTAAVPIVPLLEFVETLDAKQTQATVVERRFHRASTGDQGS